MPLLCWTGPWFAEVLHSVRDAREREPEVFDFLRFFGYHQSIILATQALPSAIFNATSTV